MGDSRVSAWSDAFHGEWVDALGPIGAAVKKAAWTQDFWRSATTGWEWIYSRHDQDDTVYQSIQINHDYVPGDSIEWHIHYSPKALASGTQYVYWKFLYVWVPIGAEIPAPASWGSLNVQMPVVAADRYKHLVYTAVAPIASPASNTVSSMFLSTIVRAGTDPLDTYNVNCDAGDAATVQANLLVIQADCHYPRRRGGTTTY